MNMWYFCSCCLGNGSGEGGGGKEGAGNHEHDRSMQCSIITYLEDGDVENRTPEPMLTLSDVSCFFVRI
uniref:Secreted protein n=1 Tax=Ascaris lumbricoides TaxID=6252 RepID=A0A0M3HMA4_ASCLU